MCPSPTRHEEPLAPEMDKKQRLNINGAPQMEKKQKLEPNDAFSDYINRAKRRLGSISSKRHDPSSKGKENLKEDRRFTDYIIRARNRLRATSSTVGRSSKGSSRK